MQNLFAKSIITNSANLEICNFISPCGLLKSPTDALDIYARAYVASLTEALGETFEGVWSVLGDECFFSVAYNFIMKTPSTSFNLSNYGNDFPRYIGEITELKEYPFLSDLAKFELIFKDIFHKKSPCFNEILNSEIQIRPECKFLFLNSAKLFKSKYSVYEIWKSRKENNFEISSNFESEEYLLVYKSFDEKVWVLSLNIWQYQILSNLFQGMTFEESIVESLTGIENFDENEIRDFFSNIRSIPIIDKIN